MLSILIPTYNHECLLLVDELVNQIETCGLEAEIVVFDDGSTNMDIMAENAGIEDMPHCRYIVSPQNRGIARTRNLLMDEAKYDLLLFLDSDVWPTSDDFLRRYVTEAKTADVIVGGMKYRTGEEAVSNPLRIRYGLRHEVKSVKERNKKPYHAFISANFMIHKNVAEKIRFDETFDRYGHEDTLFGATIQEAGFSIAHFDNPVYHDNTDTQEQYLSKVRIAIQSLSMHREKLTNFSRLLRLYNRLDALHLSNLIYLIYKHFRHQMEKNLMGSHPSMIVLGVYKISYLCGVMKLG